MPATNKQISLTSRLFVDHGKAIEGILREAIDQALLRHRKLGQSIAVWRNGKVEIIPPDQIVLSSERPDTQE